MVGRSVRGWVGGGVEAHRVQVVAVSSLLSARPRLTSRSTGLAKAAFMEHNFLAELVVSVSDLAHPQAGELGSLAGQQIPSAKHTFEFHYCTASVNKI